MSATGSHRPNKIVVVDDDARIRDLLRRYLSQEGFEVLLAEDGKALGRVMTRDTVDLIVLDLMLPGEDGLSICRKVRQRYDGVILMLTARTDDMDQVLGLDMGADDYVCKPVRPRLLLARINALLRRSEAPAPGAERQSLQFGPLRVFAHRHHHVAEA